MHAISPGTVFVGATLRVQWHTHESNLRLWGDIKMGTYIALANWTHDGVKNLKDSPKRVDSAREMAKKYGCTMGDFFMTIGPYDMVVMIEAPDDAAAARFSLALASGGNVRTTTLKAFTEDAYRKVIAGL
jgi:uncharacterized protein with GYD domain